MLEPSHAGIVKLALADGANMLIATAATTSAKSAGHTETGTAGPGARVLSLPDGCPHVAVVNASAKLSGPLSVAAVRAAPG
jgi:hypothetical protein